MMAKIVKGRAFKGVIKYILDKQKDTQVLDADGLRVKNQSSVIQSFITQASLNTRIAKPVCHISLDFSAQDKDKMSNQLMVQIARDYMEQMGIKNTQYIIARHFDKEHPHIHLVYNRIDNDGKTITDSNDRIRSERICKKLTDKYGLYFSSGKENVKEHRLREPDKTKYDVYHTLEALVPKCKNWKQLISELKKSGVETEFKYKGNSDEVQGIKFQKNDYWFNGSKIDRQFSYSKIDYQLNQNNYKENIQQAQSHSDNNAVGSTIEAVGSVLGGLLDVQPNNPYNEEEAEFQRQLRKKKKPTRKYGRQM
jgi:Relaxase/Mobilisation nuclease domain.